LSHIYIALALLLWAMTDESKKESAVRRVKAGLITLGTFARIREELILKRLTTAAGKPTEQLEQLIRLNEQTMDETKKILLRAEDDLLRELGSAT
jgi:hypothetical protein